MSETPPRPDTDAADWLSRQADAILNAPDGDSAIRRLLAMALAHIATLEARLAEARIRQAPPGPRPSLRPAILALLAEAPRTRPQIEAALAPGRSLADPLRRLVRDGRLSLVDGHYALPGTPAATPAPGEPAPRRRGGRPRRQPVAPA